MLENDFISQNMFSDTLYPGVAATNDAIESFNNIVKRNYTLGVSNSLPVLFDLILEHIFIHVSLDIESQRKCNEVQRKPDILVRK